MLLIGNIFSFNMISHLPARVEIEELTTEQVRELVPNAISIIRRQITANMLSQVLDYPIGVGKQPIELTVGDRLIVGILKGTRIPNNATILPEGTYVQWMLITVID